MSDRKAVFQECTEHFAFKSRGVTVYEEIKSDAFEVKTGFPADVSGDVFVEKHFQE